MQSKAATVAEYLKDLPPDRRKAIQTVRKAIRAALPEGVAEGMQYGMIGYFIPHSIYPDGYHCNPKQPLPFGGLASQKNHMSVYFMCHYASEASMKALREAWAKTGKKLDMGKSCIRFRKVEDLALDALTDSIGSMTVEQYIQMYESALKAPRKGRPGEKKAGKRKTAKSAKSARKKTVKKKAAKK